MKPVRPNQQYSSSIPVKIVAVYAIFSGLWIFFSDSLLDFMVSDSHLMSHIAILKGWFFVLVTSVLLFLLISRYVAGLKNINEKLEHHQQQLLISQSAIRESERRFRELMEQVHMIAVMLDEKGDIIFCNDFLLQLTGWSREEIMGTNWFDTFIPQDIREMVKSVFQQGLSTGEICPYHENGILTRNGAECLIVWDNTLLRNASGAVIGVACLGIDVSSHRDLEAQLRQSQKMESIGTLAGGVAHDFNNILTVIMSCSEMLRSKLDDRERALTLADQIYSSAQRAAKLTRSLLAFSRKQQIVTQAVDLNELIFQLHDFLERVIGEDVELKTVLSEMPLTVMADKGQIEQVIMNIVSNARDAMPYGGTLKISTGMTRLDGRNFEGGMLASGIYAFFTLEDTGIGMSSQELERIFEPFFTTKEVGKGTGLGLSMAYGIIRQHKGWISVDSKVGGGSCFSVYLPKIVIGESAEKAITENPRHGVESILLVEDDEHVLLAMVAMLEDCGYHVLLARNGVDAVKLFNDHHEGIDLVISDVIMPQMNGRQLYEELKKKNPHLRILFTSGYTFDVLDRTAIPENCPLISKPLIPHEFLGTVRNLLDRSD